MNENSPFSPSPSTGGAPTPSPFGGFGAPRGQAVLAIEVGADGRLTRCLPFASSGNAELDQELCRLLGRTRWEPARDRAGRPIPVALRYVATWNRD